MIQSVPRGRTGFDVPETTQGTQRVAAYRAGPAGQTASAITKLITKAKAYLAGLVPQPRFALAPSLA